jgi:hypothetical protein
MLEIIEGFADNVVAVAAKGQVSRRDYSDVLVPDQQQRDTGP